MEGDDCEFHYGDGTNEAQDSDFPTVERSRLQEMLALLGLETYQGQKLSLQDSLQISSDSMKNWAPQAPKDLPWSFLRKLQALNTEARSTTMVLDVPPDTRPAEKESQMEEEIVYWDTADDISADIYSFSELPTPDTPVNPLDLLCALLHSSDSFLQQEIVLKMALCQFALPLVLPDSENHDHVFLLWALRGTVRTCWPQPPRAAGSFREDSVVLARAPAFAFVRMEVSTNSKSQLLNAVLSPGHRQRDCFWHRDLNLGTNPREIADGLVEISWFLPSGREDVDIFPEPVAFLNLRGDIGSHWLQFKLLTEISSAVFILTDNISKKEYKLLSSVKGSATKYYFILSPYRGKRNTNLRFLNRLIPVLRMDHSHVLVKVSSTDGAGFVRRVRAIVAHVTRSPCRRLSVEDMAGAARKLGLRVDEDCEECQRAKDRMERITRKIKDADAYRRDELRLQGDPWRKAAQVERELCQVQWAAEPPEKHRAELRHRLLELRMQQNGHAPPWGLQEFVWGISSPSAGERQYFLRWMEWGLARLAPPRPRPAPEAILALRPKHCGAADLMVVLSALGVPGTGKSTLLNTMFGLRFATGRGCGPRGAFMQLITVAESFSQDLGCDHILVIDSGGVVGGVLSEAGDRLEREASLATLIMGLSNVTVVSLAETRDIPPAILHAFLRLEKTGHMPNCQFVYQNLHDVSAPGSKPRERRQLLDQPGDVSRAAAQMEKQGDGLRTLADLTFCDPEKQHIWHIPGLWHGVPPMAAVSSGYSEAIFELKRCLLENIRNGLSNQNKDIQQLLELVRRL
nr:up-regulator of cell proliferation [Vicugna pacos]